MTLGGSSDTAGPVGSARKPPELSRSEQDFLLDRSFFPRQADARSATHSSRGTLDVARSVISATAAYGTGTYTQAIAVSLTIPAGSKIGTYTGTLTTTISAGP
jgi:hypothetical protein